MIGLLAMEFLLGMTLNLYVTIPSGTPLSILESDPILIGHVLIGVMLVGISSQVVRLGALHRDRRATIGGAVSLVSALGAFLGGVDFTFGGQNPGASLVMSVGFTGILVAAAILLVPSSGPAPPESVDRPEGRTTPAGPAPRD